MMGSSLSPKDTSKLFFGIIDILSDPEKYRAEMQSIVAQAEAAEKRMAEAQSIDKIADERMAAADEQIAAANERVSKAAKVARDAERMAADVEAKRLAVEKEAAANASATAELNKLARDLRDRQAAFDKANEDRDFDFKKREDALASRAAQLDEREDKLARAEAAYKAKAGDLNRILAKVPGLDGL